MDRIVQIIKNRLSLRQPQADSLEILNKLTEVLDLVKGANPAVELAKVRELYPTCTDFERDFPSVCFSLATGVGFAAIDFATHYVKEREAFGKPLSSFEAIQWMIADSYTELEAAQLLVLRAAFLKENRQPFTREASMAKLFATEAAKTVTIRAVQMLGGYGYTREYPVERYLRDIIGTTLYEGTSEVQRLVIARETLNRKTTGGQKK